MKRKVLTIFIALLILVPTLSNAQYWKRHRYEFSLGIGASNFLGDLGGADQIGTHYFKDLEWTMTRFAAAMGLRYKLSDFFALNAHFTYGRVAGDDKLTKEFFRNYRNLNFTSPLLEFNTNFEFAFQQEQLGHRYRLKRVKGIKAYEIYTYGFVGIGVFYFNPTTTYLGQKYHLHDLHTEGEGIDPARKKYHLVQPVIPIGIGFKYTINRQLGVGLEFGVRKTFTDYIDDVSTTYFNFNDPVYAGQFDAITVALADRSNHSRPYITAPGEMRGQHKYTDAYMFAIFSVNYKMRTGRHNLPLF